MTVSDVRLPPPAAAGAALGKLPRAPAIFTYSYMVHDGFKI